MKEMKKTRLLLCFLIASVILAALLPVTAPAQERQTQIKSENGAQSSLVRELDKTVSPGDDFFRYANGLWMKSHTIPSDRSVYSSFDEVRQSTREALKEIAESLASRKDLKPGSNEQKVGDFYRSGMDVKAIDRYSFKAIDEEMKRIDSIKTVKDVQQVAAYLQGENIRSFFEIYAEPDPRNSSIIMARLLQGGLALPDRDYYTKTDDRTKKLLSEYRSHVEKVFTLAGYDNKKAAVSAKTIIALESRLAEASFTNVENRDIKNINNMLTVGELEKQFPHLDWKLMLNELGCTGIGEINVGQLRFLKELDKMLTDVQVSDWKTFLTWKLLSATSPYLSSAFEEEHFNFFGKRLEGLEKMEPRWKKVISSMNQCLGEIPGRLFVEKHFSPLAKKKMQTMVSNIKKAFGNVIDQLSWMSDTTKAKAREKLNAMDVKIGYPDVWQDYSKLQISPDCYVRNILNGNRFEFRYGPMGIAHVGKPPDKTIWLMPPQTVNACYEPSRNEMLFPAGILQPPFFDVNADDATNYGSIGAVIAHEMTHGFDDQGRLYDSAGNLKDWWTEKDAEEFNRRTHLLVEQFNDYQVLPGVHINGELTLGENIADLGGVTIAYNAWKLSLGKQAPEDRQASQQFFLSYARIWRTMIRDEALRKQVRTDVHSPARFRVNGTLFNVPAFYEAFPEIRSDNTLYRATDKRPVIWGAGN
jgi:putative endopeptidase